MDAHGDISDLMLTLCEWWMFKKDGLPHCGTENKNSLEAYSKPGCCINTAILQLTTILSLTSKTPTVFPRNNISESQTTVEAMWSGSIIIVTCFHFMREETRDLCSSHVRAAGLP